MNIDLKRLNRIIAVIKMLNEKLDQIEKQLDELAIETKDFLKSNDDAK